LNIVISGCSGYLGYKLAYYLNNKGNNIFAISSVKIKDFKNFKYEDMPNISLEDSVIKTGIDLFIITAGFNNVDSDLDYKKALNFKMNHLKKINKLSKKTNLKKIIYLSSIHVYSDNLTGVINEYSNTTNMSNYAKIHIKSEKYLLNNFRNSIKVIARLSNVFGYSNNSKNGNRYLANDLMEQIFRNKKLIIKSKNNFYRDFITFDYFLKSIFFIINNNQIKNEIVNISSGNSINILTMCTKIINCYYKKYKIKKPIIFKFTIDLRNKFYIESKLRNTYGFNYKQNITKEINSYLSSL